VVTEDPREVVRRGYDALSARYDEYSGPAKYQALLGELRERVPPGRAVLDLGCGSGLPVARDLAAAGYRVTGVDISEVQISRARELVPQAGFLRADVTTVDFAPASFDAVICLYMLIHLPLEEQPPLLSRIASWLRPGGLFVATTGYRAWTGVDENWLGGGVPMWWSQADAATYRSWLTQAGLSVEREEFVPEGDTGHALFWASRPSALQPARPSGRPRDKRVIRPPGGDMKLSGRHVIVALALAGAAILLPSMALASTSGGASPAHPAVTPPACATAHPALPGGAFVWLSLPGDGFAGGVGYVMEITNEGRHACSLRGVPGAAVQGGNGRLIGSRVPASGQGPLITLKPGATAHFLLTIHIAGAVCAHPVTGQVLIYLPGQQQAQNGWQSAPACPGLRGGGVLSTGTIQPGTGIPDYDV
jgi:SAM-dependent methyltransferase